MLEGEPMLTDPGSVGEVLNRREVDGWRFPPGEEVDQDGDRGDEQPRQDPRGGEGDHATEVAWTSACLSAIPNGISVVITS